MGWIEFIGMFAFVLLTMQIFPNIGIRKGWPHPFRIGWVYLVVTCVVHFFVRNESNSPFLGFVTLILCFLLFLLITIAIPANPTNIWLDKAAQGEHKQCPFCAETIKSEAVKCRFCGSGLINEPVVRIPPHQTPEPAPYESPQVEFDCEHCGQEMVSDIRGVGNLIQCPTCCSTIRIPRDAPLTDL